jgi:hypothetical protein
VCSMGVCVLRVCSKGVCVIRVCYIVCVLRVSMCVFSGCVVGF